MTNTSQCVLLNRIKQRCEEDFTFFARYFFKVKSGHKFVFARHLQKIARALMRVWRGRTKYLIINIPPRYGKTRLAVKLFSAWCFMKNPACKFIHISFSDSLVIDNSNEILNTLKCDEFQQLWNIEFDKESVEGWSTTAGGTFLARPSGGQITGYGAGQMNDFKDGVGFCGCMLIDDPLKPDDAYSDAKRTAINRRWDETFKSRLNSTRTPVIVIMQRLHEDDFCGMLLRDPEYQFRHLLLPAIVDEGTDNEHALWEEKHTLEQLQAMRSKNPYMFAGQMQQRPSPLGGGIIKGRWFGYYDVLPSLRYRAIFVDTAQKEKQCNDYQVASCWGLGDDGNLYLIDLMRAKFQAYELEERIPAFWNKQLQSKNGFLRYMGVEDKASGTQLIQTIKNKTRPAIPVREIKRSTSKLERVMDVQGFIRAGYVKLPRGAPFLYDFIYECESFTENDTHAHDDQIDTMCDAISFMLATQPTSYSDL